jgi:hypothetical protein
MREFGFGDTDLLVKWRLTAQNDIFPAIALGLGYTIPTGNEEQGLRSVQDQSVRVMLIGTSEQEMPDDYFIGIYFEGQTSTATACRGRIFNPPRRNTAW